MTLEEYQETKEVGSAVGSILEDKYELKKQVIDISKNFAFTHDLFYLRNHLNQLEINQETKNLLLINIGKISDLKGEKLIVYSNSVYIPNDEEFIENSNKLLGTKPLIELYQVPLNVITSKIFEINKYAKIEQKSNHRL